jgi:hypothetical protein
MESSSMVTVALDPDVFIRRPVALMQVFGGVLAVGQFSYSLAGALLRVGDDLVEGGEHDVFAAALDKLADALLGDVVRRDLGAQVAPPDGGRAYVGQEAGRERPARTPPSRTRRTGGMMMPSW